MGSRPTRATTYYAPKPFHAPIRGLPLPPGLWGAKVRITALKERLEEVDTDLGELGEVIQEALDETFEEHYAVRDVRITKADQISVIIDLLEDEED